MTTPETEIVGVGDMLFENEAVIVTTSEVDTILSRSLDDSDTVGASTYSIVKLFVDVNVFPSFEELAIIHNVSVAVLASVAFNVKLFPSIVALKLLLVPLTVKLTSSSLNWIAFNSIVLEEVPSKTIS